MSPTLNLYSAALEIQKTSGHGSYDSLIVAAAPSSGYSILYSEDLQHGRRFEAPTIIDPFVC